MKLAVFLIVLAFLYAVLGTVLAITWNAGLPATLGLPKIDGFEGFLTLLGATTLGWAFWMGRPVAFNGRGDE